MAKKKTLYKIPTEEEIKNAKPTGKKEPLATPEPPVKEPAPIAVLDTAEEKMKSDALRLAEERVRKESDARAKQHEKDKLVAEIATKEEKARKFVIEVGHFPGDPVADFDSISVGDARQIKANEEARRKHDAEKDAKEAVSEAVEKPIPTHVMTHEDVRQKFKSTADFAEIEGIEVGGRNVVHAKAVRQLTKEKRRENIEKRKSMTVMVAGEKQELSEASKYMLDMLIKNPNKE
jgi:hypothetical protein